ncbi:transposase [Saccharothrix sp. NPDC042600]|uniref:transposase n=1 Tax=Saccharothrix TaxID=2071 RepID=UPI0033E1218A
MSQDLVEMLVPCRVWQLVHPALPEWPRRRQGGGTEPKDDRASLAAVAFVLVSGCSWREVPPVFGISRATAHRRFVHWTEAGVWDALDGIAVPGDGWDAEFRWLDTVRRAARRRTARPEAGGRGAVRLDGSRRSGTATRDTAGGDRIRPAGTPLPAEGRSTELRRVLVGGDKTDDD